MQAIQYSIRYGNQIVEEDTLTCYGLAKGPEDVAAELAEAYLANHVYDLDASDDLGEPIVCQISPGLFEVQFVTPFSNEHESVVVRFI